MPTPTTRSLNRPHVEDTTALVKAARIAALADARKNGWLEQHSYQEIANILDHVNRSTIQRNLDAIDRFEQLRIQFLARLENLKP